MISPTPEQMAILETDLGPMRISAGAGTGKTTTVALLVADLVERRHIDPEQVLGLTFTNKASAELADRVRTMLSPVAGPGRDAEIHTYHGFAAQLISEFGTLVGIERGSSVITPTFARQLLFDVVQHRRFEHLDATWDGTVDRIQRLGSALGDHLADPAAVAASATADPPWPERLDLLLAWKDYQAEKGRLGVVDYADLIAAAARLLKEHPEVVRRVRDRYRVVLLDEYQDTNPAQRVMLQRLFSDGFPVVAVGDPDQTIYEWRGATPANFERFSAHFPGVDGSHPKERSLNVNRRSDQLILDVANRVRVEIGHGSGGLTGGPTAGEGVVQVRWAADAVVEADWIGDQMTRLHQEGVPWSEMAVLFRKNRFISQVHDALSSQEIPVEVANLGGLLSVPEVTDVRAWMRIIDAPEDGPALLRILMGPRFGLGMGDLIHLTRWARAKTRSDDTRSSEPEVDSDHERVPDHTMIEAIDHLDAIGELSGRALLTLERFRSEFLKLLEFAQGASLAELTRTILDVTGTWHDVEAMGDAGRLSARLNLYRFLDLTEEWSPLEGRPSLSAFLAHLRMMEGNPAEELDAARLSGEEAVALLTVHRAKGLEWDIVFVPGVTKSNFPSDSRGLPNPYRSPQWLPHEWRLDDPPDIDAETPEKEATDILRAAHLRQEWRTAYVAVTRARHRLLVSGANWYGATTPTQKPSLPSPLFELVARVPGVVDAGTDPVPERPEILRTRDRTQAPDPLFDAGWAEALRRAAEAPGSSPELANAAGLASAVRERVAEYQQRLFDLESVPTIPVTAVPTTSVTGLVSYAACPRRHYWTEIDRLPRRPSPSARRGVDVHRLIELHGLGRVPMSMTSEDRDGAERDGVERDDSPGGSQGAVGKNPFDAYLDSSYAARKPILVEVPFQFDTEAGLAVRGRIDAIYPADNGGWEIVDFKSGRRRTQPWLGVQLQAYAVAAERVDLGLDRPESLSVSFVYLGQGLDVDQTQIDSGWMTRASTGIEALAEGIVAGEFAPVPSAACHSCEFVRFCGPGAEWLSEQQP